MTTKTVGGSITGLLALTMEAQVALLDGDWVHLVGDYSVAKADGSKAVLGKCSVRNVKRISTIYGTTVGQPNVPGVVTVEAPGFWVSIESAAGTVTAGDRIVINADGAVKAPTAAQNEVQVLTIDPAATGGTYTLSYNGQTTAALAYNASAATIQTAVQGLSTVGAGQILVTGTGNSRTFTAAGTFAGTDISELVLDESLVTPSTATYSLRTVTQGASGAPALGTYVGIALTSAVEGGTFDMLAR